MSKVLIVVDYQNDFVTGALGFEKAETLEKGIAGLIEETVENGGAVICTMDSHREDYLETQEGTNLPVEHCFVDTKGWDLYGEVGEIVDKYRKDGEDVVKIMKVTFGSDKLGNALYAMEKSMMNKGEQKIDEIELCGVVTNMCVISNAVIAKSIYPEAKIIINESLCASFDDELHDKAIDVMESMQMEIKEKYY